MCPRSSILLTCACLLAAARPTPAHEPAWSLRLGAVLVVPDGSYEAVRENGKRVTTEMSADLGLAVEIERRLTARLGLALGFTRTASHELTLRQDLPDGSVHRASDAFPFQELRAGVAYHLTPGHRADVLLVGFVSAASFGDVVLASAGPPYDRTAPLEVDVRRAIGGGGGLSLELPFATGHFAVCARVDLAVIGFRGEFPSESPDGDEPPGDLDLDFNPVRFGLGVRLLF